MNDPAREWPGKLAVKEAWFLKKLLGLLPAKKANIPGPEGVSSVGFLFSGTYGDVVQCVSFFEELKRRYPTASISVYMNAELFETFRGILPDGIARVNSLQVCLWALAPRTLIFTNVVGVFRVGFEFAARFCASRSLGFCYTEEKGRHSYSFCIQLPAQFRYITRLNHLLLEKVEDPSAFRVQQADRDETGPLNFSPGEFISPDGNLMFHIGSAGLQRDVGKDKYLSIITQLLNFLVEQKYKVSVITGPFDRSLINYVGKHHPDVNLNSYDLPGLKTHLEEFKGTLLCFNSFFAHFTYLLGKKTLVIHHNKIPRGYDCTPLHWQEVLLDEDDLDLTGVFRLLERSG